MFKESFKYYKSKQPPPSLQDVMDFENKCWSPNINQITCNSNNGFELKFGLQDPQRWCIFELFSSPGLIFIRNPFTTLGQRYWTIRCLRDYPFLPNRTNLKETLFDISTNETSELKLRWATLGYHHNWDTKKYTNELKSDFPKDLSKLSKIVSKVLGFEDFKAEAAIVNYYYFNSTLSGHIDNSEEDLEAPLLSFSFGQSAIFLIGGRTLEEKPTPILIRSGDIVVMTKKARLCYHGVPKILENKNGMEWDDVDLKEEFNDEDNIIQSCFEFNSWFRYENFLRKGRINMNVRQVLKREYGEEIIQ